MKKFLTITALFIFCYSGIAQNINGFWKGTLTMTRGCFSVNNIELQINIKDGTVSGDSYHYLDVDNYVKKRIRGTYDADHNKVTLNEFLVTAYKIPFTCRVCIKNYELTYKREGDHEYLQGTWNGTVMNTNDDCLPGNITLSRIKQSAFAEVPEIKVDTGTIRLDFYDNAEIDGDSISIMLNNKLLLAHQKLDTKPITVFVRVDLNNTFNEIEMIAENLGTIPPNTAMLIITAGTKRYELFLTSTKQKSAKVRFEYDADAAARANAN